MNVLLINPWIYDFAAYDLWLKPLGLLNIASFLEKFGYKVSLINCLDRNHPLGGKRYKNPPANRFNCGKFFSQEVAKPPLLKDVPRKYKRYGIPPEIFEEELSHLEKPHVVGITSGMTYWYPGVFEVIKRIKEKFPKTPVILGGIYASLCFEHARKFSGADYIIKGKGEIPFLKILDGIKGVKRDYSRICWKKIQQNLLPAYHLLYRTASVAILTSRGCPFRCSYCASFLLEDCFIQKDPEKVLNEISYYVNKFKVKDIAFYDDALLINAEKHIIPILEGIIKKFKGKVRFHTPNGLHIKFIDEKMAKLFYSANFKTIRLSFESISSNKASEMDLVKAVENFARAGYKKEDLGVYIMVGLPGQDLDEVTNSIEFVRKTGARVKIAEFSPIPGTAEFEKAIRHSCLPLQQEPLFQNNSIFYLWNKKISYQDLLKIKKLSKKEDECGPLE